MRIIFLAALAMILSIDAMSQKPVNQDASPEAKELLRFIYAQSGNGKLIAWGEVGKHRADIYNADNTITLEELNAKKK